MTKVGNFTAIIMVHTTKGPMIILGYKGPELFYDKEDFFSSESKLVLRYNISKNSFSFLKCPDSRVPDIQFMNHWPLGFLFFLF